MNLRHGHLADLPGVYEVCHLTGHAGQDATSVVSDRWLLGQYFAAPYLVRDPSWCWVAADEAGVAGYLVSTPDTRAFVDWMNRDWLPAVQGLYPQASNPGWTPFEVWLRSLVHAPATFPDFVDEYPAHLHIDFLPRAQGQGLGTRFVGSFLDQLKAQGIPGFHLGVGTTNTKAQAFYAKLGFRVIRETPGALYLGLKW